jgi:hypothetical protein
VSAARARRAVACGESPRRARPRRRVSHHGHDAPGVPGVRLQRPRPRNVLFPVQRRQLPHVLRPAPPEQHQVPRRPARSSVACLKSVARTDGCCIGNIPVKRTHRWEGAPDPAPVGRQEQQLRIQARVASLRLWPGRGLGGSPALGAGDAVKTVVGRPSPGAIRGITNVLTQPEVT